MMQSRTSTLPLLPRIAAALAAVALVPLIVSYSQIKLGRDATVEQARTTHLVAARAAANRISEAVSFLQRRTENVAASPRFHEPLSRAAQGRLQDVLLENPDVFGAGLFLESSEGPQLVQLARSPEHAETVDQALALKDPAATAATRIDQDLWLRTQAPLADDRLSLYVVSKPKLTDRLPEEIGADFDLAVVRTGGEILVGETDWLENFPEEILDIVLLDQGLTGAGEYLEKPGAPVVASYTPVDGTSFYVLTTQPAAVAESAKRTMTRNAWIAFAATALLFGLFTLAAWRGIVLPIHEIAAAQRRLVGRESDSIAHNGIEDLKRSFAEIERRLRDREALDQVSLGRYQVVDVLGSGAMGTVFRGWDPRLERFVALKTLKLDPDASDSEVETSADLRGEAVALARIRQHPHIVTVFDVLGEGETAFIAMEHVDGMSLSSYLKLRGRLTAREAVMLGLAMFEALEAAHSESILHHDVKPANILLGRDGSIKMTDFGISEFLHLSSKTSETVFGTPGYLAPEVLRREKYGKSSDLFAVGVILYECLIGFPPFYAATPRQVMIKTMTTDPKDLQELRPEIPDDLADLIMLLLSREAEKRPDVRRSIETLRASAQSLNAVWEPDLEAVAPKTSDPDSVFGTLSFPTGVLESTDRPSKVTEY